MQRLLVAIESLIPGDRLTNAMWSPPPVEAWSPALAVVVNSGLAAGIGSLIVSLGVAAVLVAFSSERRWGYALVVALCYGLSRGDSIPLFVFHTVAILAMFGLAGLVVRSTGAGVLTLAGAIFAGGMARGGLAP